MLFYLALHSCQRTTVTEPTCYSLLQDPKAHRLIFINYTLCRIICTAAVLLILYTGLQGKTLVHIEFFSMQFIYLYITHACA